MIRIGLVIAAIVYAAEPWALAHGDAPATGEDTTYLAETLGRFLETHCVKCHGGEEPKGDLAFANHPLRASLATERSLWRRVLENLEMGVMPPEEAPQPAAEDRALMIRALKAELGKVAPDDQRDPGRMTLRRLNRAEYNNTIRDLFGVDLRPADDFPADDVGHGFDNIGDVLSLPPLLLERYLAAAEKIVDQLILPPENWGPRTTRYEAENLPESVPGEKVRGGFRGIYSSGEVPLEVSFPTEAEYVLRVRAFGDQAGDEAVRMALRIDGADIMVYDVPATKDQPAVLETRITAAARQHRLALEFINDYYRPADADAGNRDRNLYVDYVEIEGPFGGAPPPLSDTHRRVIFRAPAAPDESASCAREMLAHWATRAYRRPVSDEEVERLAHFVELAQTEVDSFERGMQLALSAMLVSPHFLYRVELDPPAGATARPINDFELASRLSYFLWSSMPDETLFDEARRGTLHEAERLEAHVRRMVADAKSVALVDNFAGQWLQIRNLETVTPDPKQFPTFDDNLRRAMLEETRRFVEAVIREDRSVLEFLDADFTFLNEQLARHYAIEGVSGDEFRRVALQGDQRGGLLSQASVLTVTSNPTRTSPVKRGKWVLEQLLGAPPPPPPPNVEELAEGGELTGTLRQRMEQHRANPSCAACHSRMDPLGFGLENYDAIGAWRDREGEAPIDASGTLASGESFQGPKQLKALLRSKRDAFRRCLAEKLLTYALGRGVEEVDQTAITAITGALSQNGDKFSSLVLAIVRGDPFQMRRAKGIEP